MKTSVFGLAEPALMLSEKRASLLAHNLVNSATPHYKARDIDFKQALHEANNAKLQGTLNKTHGSHIRTMNTATDQKLLYRIPMQVNSNGNTVDNEIERKNYMTNALNYEASLTFIQNKVDSLMKAIKGD